MPKYVSWDDAGDKSKGNGAGALFLKLEPGKKYRIRLVSNPVVYYQHWEPVICRSPGVDPKTQQTLDPLMLTGATPKKRFAIWVFDRDDANKLKVMDFPPSLCDQFAEWKANFGEAPGGPNGPDWFVKLEVPGTDRRRTKYKASNLEKAPFTEEEIRAIKEGVTVMQDGKEVKVSLKDRLTELRKENTPDEIRALLAAKQDPSGPSKAATTTIAPSASSAPAGEKKADDDGYPF